jgi:signal transduction histidine kinase
MHASDRSAVLHRLCHAFASTNDLEDAISSAVKWLQEAVGTEDATVRVVLPDRAGRLRLAAFAGTHVAEGQMRSTRRRQAFVEKRPIRVRLRGRDRERVLAILPCVTRGESVAVVEVITEADRIDERWDLVEAVASQTAIVVGIIRERREAEQAMAGLRTAVDLAGRLSRAGSPDRALRIAVDAIHHHLQVPTIGVLRTDPGAAAVCMRGIARSLRPRVTAFIEDARADVEAAALVRELAMNLDDVHVIERGDALIVVAGGSPRDLALVEPVCALLADASDRSRTAWSGAKAEDIEIGLALTAHEIRGPLLGTRAAIDYVLGLDRNARGAPMLRRTIRELEWVADIVEPLLRWSAGDGQLRRRRVDVVGVARQAVESLELETGEQRISLTAKGSVEAPVDPTQLRAAIANVLRNALAYSPSGSPVHINVSRADGRAVVTVRDRGPGVPPAEREAVFRPFSRGSSSAAGRNGSGLGLFITRRIVEAHGGAVALRTLRGGSACRIEVPLAQEGRRASAS